MISRRQLLTGALAMAGDGLVRPVNAPGTVPLAYGTQPGSPQTIIANKVIVSGAGGGVFVYSGTPALGNPPIAWMGSGLVDPFGNVLPSTTGVASSGTFQAGDLIITPSGEYVYSTTPAAGKLIASLAPAAGTDPFADVTVAGVAAYVTDGDGLRQAVSLNQSSILGTAGVSINETAHPAHFPPGFYGQGSGTGGLSRAVVFMDSGTVAAGDSDAAVSVQSQTHSGVTAGLVELLSGRANLGNTSTVIVDDNNGAVNLANTKSSVPAPALGSSHYVDANAIIRYQTGTGGDGNAYATGSLTQSLNGTQLISSTTPVQITNMSFNVAVAVRYRLDMMITWTGAGTSGSANFGFNGSATTTQQSVFFWTQGPASGTSTGGLIASPTLVTSRQGLSYTALVVCSVAGTFNVRAQISSGGSNFTINNSYVTLTPL